MAVEDERSCGSRGRSWVEDAHIDSLVLGECTYVKKIRGKNLRIKDMVKSTWTSSPHQERHETPRNDVDFGSMTARRWGGPAAMR